MRRDLLPMIQEALRDRYTVEREMARGGAGRVFFARNLEGTAVALKVLHPERLEGVNVGDTVELTFTEALAIKVVAARLQTRVVDRAMQVFGAMGLTPDTPLAYLWTWGRALRLRDGPDEVHLRVVSRAELSRAKANVGRNSAYFVPPVALAAE